MNQTINKIFGPALELIPENNRLERIWILAKVDFKKRYYHSSLGLVWALLNPIFQLLVYYTVFTYMFERRIPNFGLYLFAGLLFWMFFSEGTKKSFQILRSKRYLIENVQFDKIDLYLASAFSALFGFVFNLCAFFIIQAIMQVPLSYQAFWFPVLVLNIFLFTMGVSLILSTWSIFLTDLHQIWDMVIMAAFWANPIFYPTEVFEGKAGFILYINPIAGIMMNFREVVLFQNPPDYWLLTYDFVFVLVFFAIGMYIFRRFSHKAVEKF